MKITHRKIVLVYVLIHTPRERSRLLGVNFYIYALFILSCTAFLSLPFQKNISDVEELLVVEKLPKITDNLINNIIINNYIHI